ncbi:MAG TPA: ABC transporter permease [Gaiellaceae bacterium]|nr:ABC transporter permease [Gaiellaceae bacterium]
MSGAGVVSVARGVAWRGIHNAFTNPALLVPALMFPMIFFVGFAGGVARIRQVPGFDYPPGYEAFQFAFVLLQSAAMGGVFTGFGIARDFEHGFARRLMLAAPRRSGIVLGYAAATMVRWLFVISVVFVVGLVLGMQVFGGPVDLLGLLVLALFVNFAGALWATGVAMRVRSTQAGPFMQLPIFLLLFLAPVFVPFQLLEGWLRSVATLNPFTPLLEAARSLLAGAPTGVGVAFLAVAGLVVALSLWALTGLRSAERAG